MIKLNDRPSGEGRAAFPGEYLAPDGHFPLGFVARYAATKSDDIGNAIAGKLPPISLFNLGEISRRRFLRGGKRAIALPIFAMASGAVLIVKLLSRYRERIAARILGRCRFRQEQREHRQRDLKPGLFHRRTPNGFI